MNSHIFVIRCSYDCSSWILLHSTLISRVCLLAVPSRHAAALPSDSRAGGSKGEYTVAIAGNDAPLRLFFHLVEVVALELPIPISVMSTGKVSDLHSAGEREMMLRRTITHTAMRLRCHVFFCSHQSEEEWSTVA